MLFPDQQFLSAVAGHATGQKAGAQARIIAAIGGAFETMLADHAIDTALRIAHFTAQIAHESDSFCTTEEYASGSAYEGRRDLGNVEPGDGKRFKGRGLIQLTGRANYRAAAGRLGLDLESDPAQAADPLVSLRIACDYWTHWRGRGINPLADRDDLEAVTRAVNGGLKGLADRRAYLARAKAALVAAGHAEMLARGATGAAVAELQRLLGEHGFPLAIDGDFGLKTETAVTHFQNNVSLRPDGIVGPKTRAALADRKPGDRHLARAGASFAAS